MFESGLKGPSRRGRPPGRWKDRVEEYLGERVTNGWEGLKQARNECWERERWSLLWRGHPLRGCLRRDRDIRAIRR